MEKKYNFVYTERCIGKETDEVMFEHQIEFEGKEEDYDKFLNTWRMLAIADPKNYRITENIFTDGSGREINLRFEDEEITVNKFLVLEY